MINLEDMNTKTELPVCADSHLIGMKIKDIENEFNVKVLHYHNPEITPETREIRPLPNKIIEFGMGIKVSGTHKDVDKLSVFAFG